MLTHCLLIISFIVNRTVEVASVQNLCASGWQTFLIQLCEGMHILAWQTDLKLEAVIRPAL